AGFRVPTRKTGGISSVFECPRPSRRRHYEQSRADRGTGHADQDVEGRCRPDDRSPVRRQGDHRGRAQEGGQGADHRLRELRSPQARGAHGSQSQDGRRDSDQSVDRPRVSRRQAAEAGGEQEISRKAQAASHGSPRWAARRLLMKSRLLVLARSCAALAGVALLVAPPRGTVRVERFFAPALGVEKHYVVYLPPSYATAPTKRYPVVYYLHGLTGNESDWVSLASIDVVADSLTAGGGAEMILVMPDGDDGWYTNWEEAPEPYAACLADTLLNRAAPALCVVRARYEDYIARDLVRHIDST